jgi:hypothetical protein
MDDLPPAVECKLWDYAYGKPVERMEVKDTTSTLSTLTPEQLEERALRLAALAKSLRGTKDTPQTHESPLLSPEESETSVH